MSEPAPESVPASEDHGPVPRVDWRPTDLAIASLPAAIPEPPSGAVLHVPPPSTPERRHWFLVQLWTEFVLVLRMYVDPRYRISRTAQLVVPAVFLLFVLNYLFFTMWLTIPVVSPFFERLIDVLLGIFLYKLLARELTRYRDVLDYLSRFGMR